MATLLLLFAWTLLPPPAWTALIDRIAEADTPHDAGDRRRALAVGESESQAVLWNGRDEIRIGEGFGMMPIRHPDRTVERASADKPPVRSSNVVSPLGIEPRTL